MAFLQTVMAVLAFGPRPPALYQQRNDSAIVALLEHQVEAAVLRRDMAYLEGVYAPDFRFKHSEGVLQSRGQWLASVLASRFRTRRLDSLDIEVHGDVALVTGRLYVLPESADAGFRGVTVRYARIYRRQGGRWQQLTHHSTHQTLGPPSL